MRSMLGFVVVVGVAASGVGGWYVWRQVGVERGATGDVRTAHDEAGHDDSSEAYRFLTLSDQAKKNLGVVAAPLAKTAYRRTIELPGVVVDRPGVSDRGVVAPIAGIVTAIHAFPGDTVAPSTSLFTLRLISDSLHASQVELFKASREIEITVRQRARLAQLAESGALAQSRIIELDNQIDRLRATVDAHRQDLQSRGLPADQIAAATRGEFVTELTVKAPAEHPAPSPESAIAPASLETPETPEASAAPAPPFRFEVQSLNVELGQKVEAGVVLCHLADHRKLLVEGRGFQEDMPLVQEAARQGWEVEVEFDPESAGAWPPLPVDLRIDHLSNTVDAESRTFAFFLPLENQWRTYRNGDETRLLWRIRPGSRVRLQVTVERFDDVYFVPAAAVVREAGEAYVFRQKRDRIERLPVQIVYEDRRGAVLADDGSLQTGWRIVQTGAASLQRVLKARSSDAHGAGEHVHADGTVHAAH